MNRPASMPRRWTTTPTEPGYYYCCTQANMAATYRVGPFPRERDMRRALTQSLLDNAAVRSAGVAFDISTALTIGGPGTTLGSVGRTYWIEQIR